MMMKITPIQIIAFSALPVAFPILDIREVKQSKLGSVVTLVPLVANNVQSVVDVLVLALKVRLGKGNADSHNHSPL